MTHFEECQNWNCDGDGCGNCPNADETCILIKQEETERTILSTGTKEIRKQPRNRRVIS